MSVSPAMQERSVRLSCLPPAACGCSDGVSHVLGLSFGTNKDLTMLWTDDARSQISVQTAVIMKSSPSSHSSPSWQQSHSSFLV